MTDQQIVSINNLRLSSQQAEDALSLGLDKLQQSLVHNIPSDPLIIGHYGFEMAAAMDKGEALEGFVNQVMVAASNCLTCLEFFITQSCDEKLDALYVVYIKAFLKW